MPVAIDLLGEKIASISLPVSFAVDAGELGLFSSRIREYLEY